MNIPKLYKKYHIEKDYTSIGLFRAINDKYSIKKVFYPGSHVHITPSLIFPDVTYADSFKNTDKFFKDKELLEYINTNKEYLEESKIRYFQQDYNLPFKQLEVEFDLIISQYAGFVGQSVKKYLKKDGLLLCNNSHGDATFASLDKDYNLIAVYNRVSDDIFRILDKDLVQYFIPKKVQANKEEVLKSMKGIAYTKSPSGYIFQKVK